MFVWLGYFLAAVGVFALAMALFVWKQGDADFFFDVSKRSSLVLEKETENSVVLTFLLPFKNIGSQQGTLMDVFARPWLPCEQFSAAELSTKVAKASDPRVDGYWEATLFPDKVDNDVAVVQLRFDAGKGDIRQAMAQMVDLHLNIMYQVVARGDWYLAKTMLTVPLEEFAAAMKKDPGQK